MSEREMDLLTAMEIVVQGCENQYREVVRKTNVHPAYREAIPVVRRHLAEAQRESAAIRRPRGESS